MLKKKTFIPNDKPVFREVIPHALRFAWTHPTHWVLGIFAAILFSGGALDIFWKFYSAIQSQGNVIFLGRSVDRLWYAAQISSTTIPWFGYIKGLLAIIFLAVIIIAVLAFSCTSQGALVNAIGTYKENKKKSLRTALTIGSRAIFPIAVLNLMLIIFIWIARFAVSFPLAIALGNNNPLFSAVYIVSFIIFAALTLGLGVLQIYALNAIILQKATLAKALERGWKLIREHWLVTIETIVVQSFVIIILTLVVILAGIILTFPATILFVFAFLNGNMLMFQLSLGIFFAVTILLAIFTTGFTVAFQYATWTMMFHKFGEGVAIPKLHRLLKKLSKKS
ncbi:MAG: hypothetical protein P1P90_03385 [Patescibacteria group bacterium]|nr:hypothetical protein [Patescibacteria group bacterium]